VVYLFKLVHCELGEVLKVVCQSYNICKMLLLTQSRYLLNTKVHFSAVCTAGWFR